MQASVENRQDPCTAAMTGVGLESTTYGLEVATGT